MCYACAQGTVEVVQVYEDLDRGSLWDYIETEKLSPPVSHYITLQLHPYAMVLIVVCIILRVLGRCRVCLRILSE